MEIDPTPDVDTGDAGARNADSRDAGTGGVPEQRRPDDAVVMPDFWQTAQPAVRPPGHRPPTVAVYGPPAPVSDADSHAAWSRPRDEATDVASNRVTATPSIPWSASATTSSHTVWASAETAPAAVPIEAPTYAPRKGHRRNASRAVLTLVLGCCSVIPLVGFFAGLAALVLGPSARRQIARSRDELGGGGMVLAGQLLGGFFVAVYVVGVALPLVFTSMR